MKFDETYDEWLVHHPYRAFMYRNVSNTTEGLFYLAVLILILIFVFAR